MLGFIARDTWALTYTKDFGHKKPITCITWLNDHIFSTSGFDKVIKIWNY